MFFRKSARSAASGNRASRRLRLPQARPMLEALETRVVPYAISGNAWPNPQLISLSFMPDGTVIAIGNGGNITSNLLSTFITIPGVITTSQWENVIVKAAQQWAQQTNINFTVVGDSGAASGSGNYQQGDPNFGDVRVGGYNFGFDWLGSTMYPPPVNNYSVAGDVAFNTGFGFNIGSTYDLFTVAMHEMGHALGLGSSGSSSAVMYGTYNGVFLGLASDDVSGIQAIYSGSNPRSHDAYNSSGHGNGSFATAANITSTIDPSALTSVVTGLDITTTTQVEYFTFTAPSSSASTMTVSVQSTGLSLLTPKMTVYNSNHTAIGSASFRLASGAVQDGATLTLSNLAVTPGATYYVAVQGVDRTAFSTGAYALTLNLGTGANPTVPLPNTQVANGNPEHSGGGQPQVADPANPPVAPRPAADANLVNGLVSNSTMPPVVAPAPVAYLAAPVMTSQAPLVAVPVRGQAEGGLITRANGTTEEAAEQLGAPAHGGDTGLAPAPQAVPDDASQAVSGPAASDAWLGVSPEAPAEQSASAPAVAEATASDWTPDGALAAASVLFGGAWLRWHAAHPRDEERRHQSEAKEKQGAP